MPENLTSLSGHKKQFQTEAMKVPVIFHASEKLLPGEETFRELENLAGDGRLFSHIAALSDVHSKKGRKSPTGAVAATENHFLPQINDTAPNCGMRLIKTDLDEGNLSQDKIDDIFKKFVEAVPTKKYIGTKIPCGISLEICRNGIAPLLTHIKSRTKNEIENSFSRGNLFGAEIPSTREIMDVIPELFIKIASWRLGILGAAGNHFLDLMRVSGIQEEVTAAAFGLKRGQYVFLMHTGSGLIGQYASYMFTPKTNEHFSQKVMLKIGTATFRSQMKKVYIELAKKIKAFRDKDDFFGLEADSLEGRMFIRSHWAAGNFGFANRSMITHNLDEALESVLGRQVILDQLYDTPHILVNHENHFGRDLWIHRNGAVRANGPARMASHPLFSKTGEPVFIPSSMSTPAYIGVGTDLNASAFFSAGHGTGRRRQTEDSGPKNKKELFERVSQKNVKLYNAKSKGILLQDSAYYKDIDEVISGMAENNIIKVVAKMEPVAVLMY